MTATNKHIPGKRIKTWHRSSTFDPYESLRHFARRLAASGDDAQKSIASSWAGGKAVR